MLKAIIVDDEKAGRETLGLLLEKHHPGIEVVATADSARTGREAILEHHPDLVFLDIQMPGGSGFDLLKSIEVVDFEVIFVSAHSQHALRAFQFAALHYIRKPIKVQELRDAILRAESIKQRDDQLKKLQFSTLHENFANSQTQDMKIALPTLEGFSFVMLKDIVRIKGSESYSDVFFADGKKLVVSRKIVQLERLLTGHRFFRIHRSHLINLDHLVRYIRGRGGEVEMSDGEFLDVSRRKKAEFLEAILK